MTAIRVAFMGDSVTQGVGDHRGIGWPERLRRRASQDGHVITNYNLGIRSDTSELIAARWRNECAVRLPAEACRAIVFSFGLNDATRINGEFRVPLSRAAAVARKMMLEARTFGPVLWIGPTAIDDSTQPLKSSLGVWQTKNNAETAKYDSAYQRIAADLAIPYLPLFSRLIEHPTWPAMLVDGVHPDADGYDLMADIIGNWSAWHSLLNPNGLEEKQTEEAESHG